MTINRRSLGSTGLKVSVIGFGASPLGGVFECLAGQFGRIAAEHCPQPIIVQPIDEEEGIAAVHEAFKLGINFFDTSPFYGVTKSETVLGKALKSLPRDEIVVATKVGRYGPTEFDFSAQRITKEFHKSLERLNVEFVDILQCHDIEFGDIDQIVNETIPALVALKDAGLVRHIGITGLPIKLYPAVLSRVPAGTIDVCLSYCHFCLNDRSLTSILPQLEKHNVGVINASCLSMGLLTASGPPEWHPAPEALKMAAAKAATIASGQGQDISELAMMWAVQDERISTTLVGMATREIVRRNVATVSKALSKPLEPAQLATLDAIEHVFADVRDVTWESGKPENN